MNHEEQDRHLNKLLDTWKAPPLPLGFSMRVSQELMRQTVRERVWPMQPLRFAVAASIAVILGVGLGFTTPQPSPINTAAESSSIDSVLETDSIDVASVDGDDVISALW